MDIIEAKILLKNLLKRVRKLEDDTYELAGTLTDDEVEVLRMALSCFDATVAVPQPVTPLRESTITEEETSLKPVPAFIQDHVDSSEYDSSITEDTGSQPDAEIKNKLSLPVIELDPGVLDLETSPDDIRLCFDFGTAMSKVTLVKDETKEREFEEIEVLTLGLMGEQDANISETMLVSSVFIDSDGLLWFGQMAVEHSYHETQDGSRQILNNIKRYLSEEGLSNIVGPQFNPTDINITFEDMILAYLMFLSWVVNKSLEETSEAYPRNLNRRFAMPCFDSKAKARDTAQRLRTMLGQAQILADTFYKTLQNGIPLVEFMDAISQIRKKKYNYKFVKDDITEPLGVAGSLISWNDKINILVMVVDVGAGTSDFSLYRINYNPDTGKSMALEVENTTRGITEAGNYLDNLLREFILAKASITHEHPLIRNIRGAIESSLRSYKETLFIEKSVSVPLFNGDLVEVLLEDFLELPQVQSFSNSLKNCMKEILEGVDLSFIEGAPANRLVVCLTGGGAELPMVKDLAKGVLNICGTNLNVVQSAPFPLWLQGKYDGLELDYTRIAVSLGGARKRIIENGGTAKLTAGDVKESPILGGFYTKGK